MTNVPDVVPSGKLAILVGILKKSNEEHVYSRRKEGDPQHAPILKRILPSNSDKVKGKSESTVYGTLEHIRFFGCTNRIHDGGEQYRGDKQNVHSSATVETISPEGKRRSEKEVEDVVLQIKAVSIIPCLADMIAKLKRDAIANERKAE